MEDGREKSNIERRAFERLKVDLSIIYRINRPLYVRVLISGEEIEATAIDLSQGGIAINTNYDIPISTALSIKIMIYTLTKANNFRFYKVVNADGEVRSNILVGTDKRRIGISFTEIDEEEKEELIRFVRINKKFGQG